MQQCQVEPVSDCDRFAATATPNLARRRRTCTLAVFSVLKSAWLLRASWVACRRLRAGMLLGVGSRVPIDPCWSPLPAPAGSQYY